MRRQDRPAQPDLIAIVEDAVHARGLESCLIATARSKGISADELVRGAIDKILTETAALPERQGPATGDTLVEAMQASLTRKYY
jgi:hypothetical protein